MSLDLDLIAETCICCGHTPEPISFNITYNLGCMWREIYPYHEKMIPIEGMTAQESLEMLQRAYDELKLNPEKFEAMNPANGWGSYEDFLYFIDDLIDTAKEFPSRKWVAFR